MLDLKILSHFCLCLDHGHDLNDTIAQNLDLYLSMQQVREECLVVEIHGSLDDLQSARG